MDFLFLNRPHLTNAWNRFARKKMRQMIVILCIFACIPSYGQRKEDIKAAVSADIPSMILDRNLALGLSHTFHGHWSAEGMFSVRIPPVPFSSEEEEEHDKTLSGEDGYGTFYAPDTEFRIGLRFWPGKFLDGAYLEIGCLHGMSAGNDIIMEFGYAMRAWKGIGFTLGYEILLAESMKRGIFSTKGLRIGINYSF